jgi:hypothetical protein
MKITNLVLATLFFATVGVDAQAADQTCPANIQTALAHTFGLKKPASEDSDSVFTSAACKLAPNDSHILIAAVAWPTPNNLDTKTLLVATLDAASGKILSQFRRSVEEDALTAIGPNSLRIDTARYQLAEGVRAFGVYLLSTAPQPRCADGIADDKLTLYAPNGKALAPVLELDMYSTHGHEYCDNNEEANIDWEEAKLTIGIEKTSSHGYVDLRVTATIAPMLDATPKHPAHKKRSESCVLHYDGKIYPVPDEKKWWLQKY